MKLSLAFSPCPNDTFIFDALVHGKIDTEGLTFNLQLADVEELNIAASKAIPDITKLSYHAYLYVSKYYQFLRSGSALGEKNGPLLISLKKENYPDINTASIAIPGLHTTANLLFSMAYPNAKNKQIMLFSDIEQAVIDGKVDYGLIIHESRFTYSDRGLHKVADMGEFWEEKTNLPIPLGGIVIRRDFDDATKQKVNRVIRRSMEYAYKNPNSGMQFIRENAQEMNFDVMKKHIDLYVNKYSLDIGELGEKAINSLFNEAMKTGIAPTLVKPYII